MNEPGEAGDIGGIGAAAETGDADEERNRISRASPASDTTVHLADVQRMLALFTQGLRGRYLHLVPNDTGQDGGATAAVPGIDLAGLRQFASAGRDAAAPASATDRIELPPRIGAFSCADDNLRAYRIAILHQLSYDEAGTFAFSLTGARRHLPGLTPPMDPDAGGASGSDFERLFAAWPDGATMRRLFMIIEDGRVDRVLLQCFPGAAADFGRVCAQALAHRPALASLSRRMGILEVLLRHSLGADRKRLQADGADPGAMPMIDAIERALAAGTQASVYDSLSAAAECHRLWRRMFGIHRPGMAADSIDVAQAASTTIDAGDLESAPANEPDPLAVDIDDALLMIAFRGTIDPAMIQRQRADALPGQTADEAAQPPAVQPDARPPRGPAARPHASTPAAANVDDGDSRSFLYDEWDHHRQDYLHGWCRLHEFRLQGSDFRFIGDVRRKHAMLARQVRQQLRFIRPQTWQRVHGVNDGEELDLDRLIDTVIDRRTGQASDDRLFVRRDRLRRDVAAAFLVDLSASTDFPVPQPSSAGPSPSPSASSLPSDPGPAIDEDDDPYLYGGRADPPEAPAAPRRRVIDVAKEALALMCDALSGLGDGHAIYGFSGEGRHHVEFHVAKEFGDRLSSRTWAALAAMKPLRSTRMGPAIRHASAKVSRQAVRLKVLIIVSDGFPQDSDYGPDRNDEEYGIQDTARALLEASQQGIQTFCVTIDPAGNDYLRRMCEADRYLVIDDVADLPQQLAKVYRTLTA